MPLTFQVAIFIFSRLRPRRSAERGGGAQDASTCFRVLLLRRIRNCPARYSMLRIAGICICLLAAADANAQTPSPDLAAAAQKQAEVRITDDAGREFEGRLLRADDKIFTVTTPDGDIPFSFERISTIYRRGD